MGCRILLGKSDFSDEGRGGGDLSLIGLARPFIYGGENDSRGTRGGRVIDVVLKPGIVVASKGGEERDSLSYPGTLRKNWPSEDDGVQHVSLQGKNLPKLLYTGGGEGSSHIWGRAGLVLRKGIQVPWCQKRKRGGDWRRVMGRDPRISYSTIKRRSGGRGSCHKKLPES